MAICAFSTRVNLWLLIFARFAHRHGAGHIGRAVQILAAAVHQQQRALLDLANAWRPPACNAASAPFDPAPAMVSKLRSCNAPGLLAEPLQRLDHLALVRQGLLHHGVDPVQEPAQRRPVADMRLAAALDLHRILGCAGNGAWVHRPHNRRARRVQPVEIPGRGQRRIDHDLSARTARPAQLAQAARSPRCLTSSPSQAGNAFVTLAGSRNSLRLDRPPPGWPDRSEEATGSRPRRAH